MPCRAPGALPAEYLQMTQSEYQFRHEPNQDNRNRGAFTVDEFCGWARIGRSKFYQEVQKGRLTLRKIGRKSVVTLADAKTWLNNLPVSS